jgi:hypothetical protein
MRRKPNDNDFAADEPNPGIGHNGHGMDPGPDQGYRISLNIPEWVSDEKVRAFESALRDQGPHPIAWPRRTRRHFGLGPAKSHTAPSASTTLL